MMAKRTTNDKLVLVSLVMMVLGISISLFALWYTISNRSAFESELRNSLVAELEKYNFPTDQEVTVDEAKLYLAVAKYCEARQDCIGAQGVAGNDGRDGKNGRDGVDGVDGANGSNGKDGYTPIKGVDYFDGEDGESARNVERQCNPERLRIEWRLEGDPNWQVEYKLAPGQTCEEAEV